ncbi:HNH endonuclease [Nocardioides sp. zg-1308]|uniref:HNH endonuclease signature motif containing protein n=1 Tax=Nocardioides sp. zg-1308 TaxID=2736253 RepID=UPI0015537BD2|nr:HNH endonuclease signature motif containing protein [Nocardioides sp. zg-1308]NPD05588.1 HNH endonuclease [Nocardioides sp. zg-1308]
MSSHTIRTPAARASRRSALDRAAAAMAAKRRVEVEVLESALDWARTHVVSADEDAAGWRSETVRPLGGPGALFGDRALPIAGEGTPLVAEFAVMELAAVLDLSHEGALSLVGDVLDLAHRLPRLWELVRALRVPAHLGREAARESRDLSLAAAARADRLLVWQPRRLNPHRVGVLVHEARLYADPDRAFADHDAALASRRVEVHHEHGAPGTSEVFMTLDTDDAIAFDRTVSTMAATMRSLGHPGELGPRRAHAVGLLADPQKALDLLAVDPADPDRPDPDTDPSVVLAEDLAHASPTPFGGVGHGAREAVVVLHVTDRDLLAVGTPDTSYPTAGGGRCPELGSLLVGRLRTWLLAADKVTVKPVLDPATMTSVDQHDPPAAMVEAVRLRDGTCVFPRCSRPSRSCDLDHIEPYAPFDEGGPPGQTRPDNLAPLCRRHHRAKTFGRFAYVRLPDGSYEWTLPAGGHVTTDPPRRRP